MKNFSKKENVWWQRNCSTLHIMNFYRFFWVNTKQKKINHFPLSFLHTILLYSGQRFADEIGLTSKKSSEANADTYNETVDASIANIFASCAFRFAHTLIPVSLPPFSSIRFIFTHLHIINIGSNEYIT